LLVLLGLLNPEAIIGMKCDNFMSLT